MFGFGRRGSGRSSSTGGGQREIERSPMSSPASGRSTSLRSPLAGSARRSLREIEVEPSETPGVEEEEEEAVYVAVPREVSEGKANVAWVLQSTNRRKKIVFVHVHRPPQKIPTPLGLFPANQLAEEEVRAYRNKERNKMNESLDRYFGLCTPEQVRCEKLVIEMDDIGKGLVELIALHQITKLVMGAAADNHYSKKLKGPRSGKAIKVQKQANPSCKIWFVCRGNLICIREAGSEGPCAAETPRGSMSFTFSPSQQLRSGSLNQEQITSRSMSTNCMREAFQHRESVNFSFHGETMGAALHHDGLLGTSTPGRRLSIDGSVIDPRVGTSGSSQGSGRSLYSASDEVPGSRGSSPKPKGEKSEEGSLFSTVVNESEGHPQTSSSNHESEDGGTDDEMYEKLQLALIEAENKAREAYEESCRRKKAERDFNEAKQKVKALENSYNKEMKRRKEIEERFVRREIELEELRKQLRDAFVEIHKANEVKFELEQLRKQRDELYIDLQTANEQLRREKALREHERVTTGTHRMVNFSEFSYLELQQATLNFDESLKIGEGGFGGVYKGFLRHTAVAIKMLNPQGVQGKAEFHQEVDVLSRVRHPNLVTLIGACPEAWALVYEFLHNGSLEDRLTCKDGTPPLSWQARTRIANEICSALIFLHSHQPEMVIHGDLKPANILLDANCVSKLGDFGICRLLAQSNTTSTIFLLTQPKGTLVYMDPVFLTTGELTTRSDVYSFGIILLRLLTGRPANGIAKEVQAAIEKGSLLNILDASAGNWPIEESHRMVKLALRCCDPERKNRPELADEAWKVLKPMMKAATSMGSSSSFR